MKSRGIHFAPVFLVSVLAAMTLALPVIKSDAATTQQLDESYQSRSDYSLWPNYSNSKYGFSYRYPGDWTTSSEVSIEPKKSATRQEFGTGLKLKSGEKNDNTVNFEVLDEPIQEAELWYDKYFAQTTIKVQKTKDVMKGERAIQYIFNAPTYETRIYLLSQEAKTYVFSSIKVYLGTDSAEDYWSNFDNVFSSLEIKG